MDYTHYHYLVILKWWGGVLNTLGGGKSWELTEDLQVSGLSGHLLVFSVGIEPGASLMLAKHGTTELHV